MKVFHSLPLSLLILCAAAPAFAALPDFKVRCKVSMNDGIHPWKDLRTFEGPVEEFNVGREQKFVAIDPIGNRFEIGVTASYLDYDGLLSINLIQNVAALKGQITLIATDVGVGTKNLAGNYADTANLFMLKRADGGRNVYNVSCSIQD